MAKRTQRIGIYSGTFDPVHSGHISFALQAIEKAQLDGVYFAPERIPRGKRRVTHFAHRTTMIRRAVRPHAQLHVLELEDKRFSVAHTLPRLMRQFPGATLVFLCGSDVVAHMAQWAHVKTLLPKTELCIAQRHNETKETVLRSVMGLPVAPRAARIVQSYAPKVSSSQVRKALREKRTVRGLLASVKAYAQQEWLYI
ncbi:hypothetical protein CSA80_03460 [Candidatus Saccharibacteria bacterium]|nr:MAG: hypothetical protein CSA80_03460 [Candidatus Saccharibacteria bacterium]